MTGHHEADDGMLDEAESFDIDYDDLEFGELIGSGKFGAVHKGLYFGTPCAIKKLFNPDDPEIKKYVNRELAMLKAIRHPNIVQFMGLTKHETGVYLVSEFAEGGDLRTILHKDKHIDLTWTQRIRWAQEIAMAMNYLHSRHCIHRDLKSENCLISDSYKLKLCDLGLARFNSEKKLQAVNGIEVTTSKRASRSKMKRLMTMCGTDEWMAPEVILGMEYDESCDVFSYGIVLTELILREEPQQRSPMQCFEFNYDEFREKASRCQTTTKLACPTELIDLTIECCQYEPEKRPDFRTIQKRLSQIEKETREKEEKLVSDMISPRRPSDILSPRTSVQRSPSMASTNDEETFSSSPSPSPSPLTATKGSLIIGTKQMQQQHLQQAGSPLFVGQTPTSTPISPKNNFSPFDSTSSPSHASPEHHFSLLDDNNEYETPQFDRERGRTLVSAAGSRHNVHLNGALLEALTINISKVEDRSNSSDTNGNSSSSNNNNNNSNSNSDGTAPKKSPRRRPSIGRRKNSSGSGSGNDDSSPSDDKKPKSKKRVSFSSLVHAVARAVGGGGGGGGLSSNPDDNDEYMSLPKTAAG